jgi:hypothetical protein
MSDKMRWRYGDTNPVVAAVDSSTVIEIGDLIYQDTDDAKPASSMAWTTNLAGTQGAFTPKFLGVAMQRSRSGDTAPIRVATSGVFEFEWASATAELGVRVGAASNTGGTALENQKVVAVSNNAYAIGRVAKRLATAATTLLVDINSTVMDGGILGATAAS